MAHDAGTLLLRAGLIADPALGRARDEKARWGGTVLEHLVAAGAIDDEVLTGYLSQQLTVPRIPADVLAELPRAVLTRLPADLATELRAVPVALDGEGNLTVALSDPSDQYTVDQVRFFTGAYVVRAVCTQKQLAWALAHYYGHMTVLGQALAQASTAASLAAPTAGDDDGDMTGPMVRVRRRAPSIPELAPRSGEIVAQAPPAEPTRLPAVVIEDGAPERGAPERSAPVVVAAAVATAAPPPVEIEEIAADGTTSRRTAVAGEASDDVVILASIKGEGRARRQTRVGVGRAGSSDGTSATAHEESTPMAVPPDEPTTERTPARPGAVVDSGWDLDDWAGATPTPAARTAAPAAAAPAAAAPEAAPVAERAPAAVVAPIAVAVTAPIAVAPTSSHSPDQVEASADRLLLALRALDEAQSRDAVVDAALAFIAAATPLGGFAAAKSGQLNGYRGTGGIARGGDVGLGAGPMTTALARPHPYRGAVTGIEASFTANLLGETPAEVTVAPVVLRARLIGAFVAAHVPALIDEHLAVLARATGLALERVLKARRQAG